MKTLNNSIIIIILVFTINNCTAVSPYKKYPKKSNEKFEQIDINTRMYYFGNNIIYTDAQKTIDEYQINGNSFFQLKETHYRGYTFPRLIYKSSSQELELKNYNNRYFERVGKTLIKKLNNQEYEIKIFERDNVERTIFNDTIKIKI